MRGHARRWLFPALVYAVLSTAVVSSLGMLLVPVVALQMDVPTSTAQWVITANLLVGAVVAPTAGRLGDGPGKKALLLGLLAVTLVGSVVAASATTFTGLLTGRVLQGFAYGLVPVAICVARAHLPRGRKAAAIATLSITVSMGLGFGYPLAGLAVGTLGLGAAFWIATTFVVVAMAVVGLLVPREEAVVARRPFDLIGAVWLSATLAAVVLGITQAPRWGWASLPLLLTVCAAAATCLLWVRSARRTRLAFVDLASLRGPDVVVTHLGAFALASTVYTAMSTASLVVQAPTATGYGLGVSIVVAGFVILPLSAGSIVASRLLPRVLHRARLVAVLAGGSGVLLLGDLLLLALHSSFIAVVAGMAVVGLGMGVVFGVAPVIVARAVPLQEVGSAVSLNQVLRTVGGTLGSALTGAVFAATGTANGFPSGGGVSFAYVSAAVVAGGSAVLLAMHAVRYRSLP